MKTLAALTIALAVAATAAGQEFRGAITGRVNDKSGGVLPGVTVTATNVATNVSSTTATTGEGLFTIPYLTPGTYTVAAELSGFKKTVREGLEVRIGDRLVVDLIMEVGQLEETVLVTAQSPLLEMGSASAGQVIDEKRISMMPLSDGNPFVLSRLVPGVAFTGDLKFSRPFDNAGTSGDQCRRRERRQRVHARRIAEHGERPAGRVRAAGRRGAAVQGRDGHLRRRRWPHRRRGGERDPQERHQQPEGRGLLLPAARRAVGDRLLRQQDRRREAGAELQPARRVPRRAAAARHRTFFFEAVEWLYDKFPEPLPQTVPTQAMRNGDFSALLAQGTIIYDPATATQVGARVVRQPFPGNIIPAESHQPDRGGGVLKLLPAAESAGGQSGAEQLLLRQSPRRHVLLDVDAHRSPADRQAAAVRALHAQRSARIPQRDLRRGQRDRPDRQLSLPDQRRRHL